MSDPLIKDILKDLESRFLDHVGSMYGLGRYFEENLPLIGAKRDLGLVVIVDSRIIIFKKEKKS